MRKLVVFLLLPAFTILIAKPVAPWKLHLRGFGPVTIGMTMSDVERASGMKVTSSNFVARECAIYEFKAIPNFQMMFTNWSPPGEPTLARIYIQNPNILTLSGIHPGSTIADVRNAYAGYLRDGHNAYTSQPEFVFIPKGKIDEAFRIIFVTDGKVVTEISIGKLPEMDLIEGCI